MSQEDEPEGSGCAGAVLLTGAGAGVGAAVFKAAPDAGVLALWVAGWTAIVWSARRRNKIHNPSPPPPERGEETANTQVEFVQDPTNPHHWIVNERKTGTS